MPSNAYDAKGLLKSAVRDPNPVIVFENKMLYNVKGEVPEEPYFVPFGVARVIKEGSDVTVVAVSDMVDYSLKAAETAEAEGISLEIVDHRTIAPLDIDTIVRSVKKTGKLVIAHEANVTGEIGAGIAAQAAYRAFDYLQAPIERVGAGLANSLRSNSGEGDPARRPGRAGRRPPRDGLRWLIFYWCPSTKKRVLGEYTCPAPVFSGLLPSGRYHNNVSTG